MSKSPTRLLLKLLLASVAAGAFAGMGSRLMLVGTASNAEILPSWLGLATFCVIAYGLAGVLYGLQHRLWAMVLPHTTILVAGIMWVIPFPS